MRKKKSSNDSRRTASEVDNTAGKSGDQGKEKGNKLLSLKNFIISILVTVISGIAVHYIQRMLTDDEKEKNVTVTLQTTTGDVTVGDASATVQLPTSSAPAATPQTKADLEQRVRDYFHVADWEKRAVDFKKEWDAYHCQRVKAFDAALEQARDSISQYPDEKSAKRAIEAQMESWEKEWDAKETALKNRFYSEIQDAMPTSDQMQDSYPTATEKELLLLPSVCDRIVKACQKQMDECSPYGSSSCLATSEAMMRESLATSSLSSEVSAYFTGDDAISLVSGNKKTSDPIADLEKYGILDPNAQNQDSARMAKEFKSHWEKFKGRQEDIKDYDYIHTILCMAEKNGKGIPVSCIKALLKKGAVLSGESFIKIGSGSSEELKRLVFREGDINLAKDIFFKIADSASPSCSKKWITPMRDMSGTR